MMSIFSDVVELPANIVLGLNAECVADPYPNKINLTIGAYRDEQGKPVVLKSVREAETFIYQSKMDNGKQDFLSIFIFLFVEHGLNNKVKSH